MTKRNIFKSIFAGLFAAKAVKGESVAEAVAEYVPAPLPYKPFAIAQSAREITLPTMSPGMYFEFLNSGEHPVKIQGEEIPPGSWVRYICLDEGDVRRVAKISLIP